MRRKGCLVKHNYRNSEMESCVEASAFEAWCVGGTEHSGLVCVPTSLVGCSRTCELMELSGDCSVPFDSCVRDKGCSVGVGHEPACNCSRQCGAESRKPV